MSLNYLLIWLAGIGGVFGAVRTSRRSERELKSVFFAALLTLGTLFISFFVVPDFSGYLACLPWLLGVMAPQILLRRVVHFYERMNLDKGEKALSWVSLFPWMRGWCEPWEKIFEAERILRGSGRDQALKLLTPVSQTPSLAALYARGRMLSLLGAWGELFLFSDQFARAQSSKPSLFFSTLVVLSLGAVGKWDEAKNIIDRLREHFEPGSEERAQLLQMLRDVSPPGVADEVEKELAKESAIPERSSVPREVVGLSVFLALAYLFGYIGGELQALEAYAFDPFRILIFNEWWRLLTCALVHIDFLHVGSNVLGIMILGPFLARELGPIRFLLLFVLSALGASCIMLTLMWFSVVPASPLVGASGGVMGIVGGYLGYYGLSYFRTGSLYHKEQLRGVVLIVVLQTLFDLSTPQVSFLAHFGGLLSGFLVFLIIGNKSLARKVE